MFFVLSCCNRDTYSIALRSQFLRSSPEMSFFCPEWLFSTVQDDLLIVYDPNENRVGTKTSPSHTTVRAVRHTGSTNF